MRRRIIDGGLRVDGRRLDEVRPLHCEAGTYPILHGSSLFSRGDTQVPNPRLIFHLRMSKTIDFFYKIHFKISFKKKKKFILRFQVLCTVTLGAPGDAQRLDSIVGPPTKRFMLHYSFPPFSINEVGKRGGLNRREVGHGTCYLRN